MNARVVAAYAAMCAIWGTTWIAIKIALTGFAPLGGAGARFIVAGLFLYAARAFAPRSGNPPQWRLILVLALTMFGGNYVLTYYAETRISSGLTAVLFGTMPFFIAGLGFAMLGERISSRSLAGALLALAGVAAISLSGEGGAWPAIAATLAASALSAFAYVYIKQHADSDPLQTLPPAMLFSGVVMALAGVLLEHPNPRAFLAAPPLLATLYLGIAGSGIAFFLNLWLLQRLAAWTVGLSSLLVPVMAVAIGALAGHEMFGARELTGAALVCAGIWLATAGTPA
jgi:drug/metabolite transporter (DMT)-like permease